MTDYTDSIDTLDEAIVDTVAEAIWNSNDENLVYWCDLDPLSDHGPVDETRVMARAAIEAYREATRLCDLGIKIHVPGVITEDFFTDMLVPALRKATGDRDVVVDIDQLNLQPGDDDGDNDQGDGEPEDHY